jgi:hypothetical protein
MANDSTLTRQARDKARGKVDEIETEGKVALFLRAHPKDVEEFKDSLCSKVVARNIKRHPADIHNVPTSLKILFQRRL